MIDPKTSPLLSLPAQCYENSKASAPSALSRLSGVGPAWHGDRPPRASSGVHSLRDPTSASRLAQLRSEAAASKTSDFLAARDQLQQAVAVLAANPSDRVLQEAAHRAQVALAAQQMPLLYRSVPVLQWWAQMVTGSILTLGVGRTVGMYGSSKLNLQSFMQAAAVWGGGSVGGAVANTAHQNLLAPLVGMIPTQFRPMRPEALLPDRLVEKMNLVRAGWGHEVRAQIAQQQHEACYLGSASNVHFAEKAFVAATLARQLGQPPGVKLNLPASIAINSAVSGSATTIVALNMAARMAGEGIAVPVESALDRELAKEEGKRSVAAAMAGAQRLGLFYTYHTPRNERLGPGQAISHRWHQGNLREPGLPFPHDRVVCPDVPARLQNMGADLRNLGESAAMRTGYLMRATAVPGVVGAVQPFVARLSNEDASRMSSLVLPIVAIHYVIGPWYRALAGGIPAKDAGMRERRLQALAHGPQRQGA